MNCWPMKIFFSFSLWKMFSYFLTQGNASIISIFVFYKHKSYVFIPLKITYYI